MKNNLIINYLVFLILLLFVTIFGISLLLSLDANLPFYRWDMYHTTIIDSYYLGSNQMPSHLAHPGVGLNFIIIIYQKILYNLGFLSSLGFDDLYSSVNLFFPYAEKMYYVRLLSPILIFFIVFLSTISLTILNFKNKIIFFLIFFLPLSVLNSLWVHNLQIRTELYSYLFFSLMFLSLILLKKQNYNSKFLLFFTFLFAILTISTKIQITLVVIIFLLIFYVFDHSQIYFKKNIFKKNEISFFKIFYLINLVLFLFFLYSSFLYNIDESLVGGTFRFNFNQFTKNIFSKILILINILIILTLILEKFITFKKFNYFFIKVIKSLVFLIAAFNVFFIIHLILPMDFETNWEFLLLNIKLLFLSEYKVEASMSNLSSLKLDLIIITDSIPLIVKNFLNNFSKHYLQFSALFFLFIFMYFNYFRNNYKVNKFSKLILILSFILIIFHLLKFTRANSWNHRDDIFVEYTIFIFIISCIYLTLNFSKNKRLNYYFLYTYLSLTFIFSLFNLNYLNQKIYSSQNFYFFQTLSKPVGGEKLKTFIKKPDVYSKKRDINFGNIINSFYNSNEEATRHIKQSTNFNLANTILRTTHTRFLKNANLKNVGFIEKNSKLKINKKIIEIIEFNEELQNKFLIKFNDYSKENKFHHFGFGNEYTYNLIVFYTNNLKDSDLPCFKNFNNLKIKIKEENKIIKLNSYTAKNNCKFNLKLLKDNMYYMYLDYIYDEY